MQKHRILSMLLALAMILTMLPAAVFAEGETVSIDTWNVSLGDNLGVNFYVTSSSAEAPSASATVGGNAVAVVSSEQDGSYVYTVDVAAAQMTDTIKLDITGGETVVSKECTVYEYAKTILDGQYADYVKQLVKEMLNYGAAAQTYFGHNTENLANAGYEITGDVVPTSTDSMSVNGAVEGIRYYGATLLFKSGTAVRFYFTVEGDISNYTFSQGEPVEKDGMYYVEISGINPQDLDKQLELTVTGGEDTLTVKYSPLNYIVRKYNSAASSDKLKALVQAMYGYHTAAKKYIAPPVVDVVDLVSHSNGWNSTSTENPGGMTFTAAENDAPYIAGDWSTRYTPVSADAIKLIRDGETVSIANTAAETIVKYSATEYYLEFWPFSQKPMQAGDEIILEGLFYNAANDIYINIEKTCFILNADSSVTVITGGYINAGPLSDHANGVYSEGIYATMPENAAPYDGWSIEYTPVTSDAYSVIRDGETINIGIPGRGTLVKYSDTEYALKINSWCTDNFAYTTDDIIVISGFWKQNTGGNAIMKIEKTYLYYDGSAWTFHTSLPTTVSGGLMQSHSNSHGDYGIYFSLAANDAPYNGWDYEYTQTSVDNIKLIRDGQTTSIGIVDRPLIVKYGETDYYLKLEGWNVGQYGLNGQSDPITTDDILIIEGDFKYAAENVTLNITKSYVYYDGSAWVCSAEAPSQESTVVDVVDLISHSNGWNSTSAENAGGMTFTAAENDAPYDTDWKTLYTPVSADAIKLIRNGETLSIGNTAAETIVKYSATEYYVNFWPFSQKPMLSGDEIILEGQFYNAANDTYINIEKTYLILNADNSVTVITGGYIDAGSLSDHSNGIDGTNGIYATLSENSAPYSEWSIEYTPVTSDAYSVIRDGETINIGIPGRGTLVKYSDTEYYLKLTQWCTNSFAFTTDDIFVISGFWKQNTGGNAIMKIEKTYLYYDGSAWVFHTSLPTTVSGGLMQTHSNGLSGNGLYFTMDANDAPYNSNWSLEYTQTSVDNIKLIRGDETLSIGIVGRPLIIKYGETDCYLKLDSWAIGQYGLDSTAPITTDDVLIIEGDFGYAAGNVTLNVTKTYVYYDGSAWVCSAILPTTVAGGVMTQVDGYGWTGGTGNLIFKMDNTAPTGGYAPTSASNVKLIRDGATYDVGYVGQDVINKHNDGWYTLEFWTIVNYKPMLANDILVVEGDFYQASTKTTLNISKTYILLNDDGSATFSTTEPTLKTIVDVVELGSHSNGWSSTSAEAPGGLYFTAPENDAPYIAGDWSTRYTPVSADTIKLIRNGETVSIANTGAETIVKYSATEYYLEFWPFSQKPMLAGDEIIIEGLFYNSANDTYIKVEKTYITLNADGTATIINDADKYIDAGTMGAYSTNWLNSGFYFAMASNDLPYNAAQEDWSVEYAPTSTAAIKLIRNGVTTESARVGAGTMIKLADGQYYMKIEAWTITSISSKDDLLDGDILVVEGDFVNASNGYTLHIDKSYITFDSIANGTLTFSVAADTDFGEVLLANSADTLKIGTWNGSYHVFTEDKLAELQAAGITKIVGVDTQWIGTDDVDAWLDRVYSYGIRVVFDMRSWDGETVPSYASHPGVLGFLMWDEPATTNFDALAELKAKYDAIDAFDGKLFYVNLLASCVANESLYGSSTSGDYDTDYVTAFLNKLDIEVLSWDNYSLISQADDTTAKGIRTDYFYNFEVMASKATDDLPLWYIMLSAGHTSGAENTIYNTPTAEELRWQMAVAMTYGVQNIDHYTYASHASDYSCMVEYDDADGDGVAWETTALYDDIKTVDNEYLAWDNIYMAYDWVGVGKYSANSKDTMLDKLENCLTLSNYGIASVSADENLLVGVFDHNGSKAYMVTNAGSTSTSWFSGDVGDGREFNMADTTVTLTLDAADYKCVAVIDNGQISYVAVENNTVTLNVEAYEGVFVIPVF